MLTFQSQQAPFPSISIPALQQWITAVAAHHNRRLGDIAYIFTDDTTILDINRRYLNHDYYTDIITFDYSHRDTISGDIFISLDTVRSNAELLRVPYDQELHRVIIHGVLHLCGINDKAPGEREQMEAAEDQALALLPQ